MRKLDPNKGLLNKERIYLSPPHMSGRELYYINHAFEQNWIAPLGPNVDGFESDVAKFCGVKSAAALSSGTAALHLALILLGVNHGDEVLVSTFTFSASVNPIVYLGATPVLVDSESDTWNMDPDLLEAAILDRIQIKGKKPKAIVVVHLYGMPADMMRIMEISNKYGIPVIEDAAEALGSRLNGKSIGNYGIMTVLSFNGNKILSTSGGGMLLSNDDDLIEKARFLSTQARENAPFYQHNEIGYNYRMSNIIAGIGRGQMEVIKKRVEQRRKNFNYYRSNLSIYKGLKFLEEPNEMYYSNRWLTTILIDPEILDFTWRELLESFAKENIETRPLWKPMHLQPVFSSSPAYSNGVSEFLFSCGICLPSGSNLTETDKNRIISVIHNAVHN